jgi:hypothetical protein
VTVVVDEDRARALPYPWHQGEHMAVVGQTGSGKSTLSSFLLPFRGTSLIFRSKPDDVKYLSDVRVKKALPTMDSPLVDRIELEPRYEEQGREFSIALDRIWKHGAWTWYGDEVWYLEELGLRPWMERLITQGRSKGITCVLGMQRPSRVSRFVLTEPRHVISFTLEGKDAKSLGEGTTDRMEEVVTNLGEFEFAWYYRPKRSIWPAGSSCRPAPWASSPRLELASAGSERVIS